MPKGYNLHCYYPNLKHEFHKAVYSRDMVAVQHFLSTAEHNVYSKAGGQTPLFVALAKNHLELAKRLFSIYESDWDAVRCKVASEDSLSDWLIVTALGTKKIKKIKDLVKDYQTDHITASNLVILLKDTNVSKAEVIQVHPDNVCSALNVLQELNVTDNLDLNEPMQEGDTLVHLAALRGLDQMLFRLIQMGARYDIKNEEGLTPLGMAAKNGQLKIIKEMIARLNIDFLADDRALEASATWNEYEIFKYLAEAMITERQNQFSESREDAEKQIFKNPDRFLSNVDFAIKLVKDYKFELGAVLHQCVYNSAKKESAMNIIGMDPNSLLYETTDNYKSLPYNQFHNILWQGWFDVIKKIYQKHPEAKTFLFKNPEMGYEAFAHGLISKQLSNEAAEFIAIKHRNELIEHNLVVKVIREASQRRGYLNLIRLLQAYLQDDDDISEALLVSLINKNFETFDLLLESSFCTKMSEVRDENGNGLLYHAITVIPRHKARRCSGCTVPLSREEREEKRFKETKKMNDIFDKLIERGVNYHHINNENRTLLHHAVYAGNDYVVKRLLDLGLSPCSRDSELVTPLHLAITVEILQLLLDNCPPEIIHLPDINGDTLIHYCVREVDCPMEFFRRLQEMEADFDICNNMGRPPLFYAENEQMVQFLLDAGVDIYIRDNEGHTFISEKSGKPWLVQMILEHHATQLDDLKDDPMYLWHFVNLGSDNLETFCAEFPDKEFVLLKHLRENCNAFCTDRDTLLYAACENNNRYLLDILLKNPKLNVNLKCKDGRVPFNVIGNCPDYVKRLIAKGADINAVDERNETQLIHAVSQNNDKLVRYLMDAGADVNIQNENGDTALHFAARRFKLSLMHDLIKGGADYTLVNNENKTCFQSLPTLVSKFFGSVV